MMQQSMSVATISKIDRQNGERGAALITVLLMSMLVLALAGTLILTTTMSATNAISSTDEIQAYYAAEAGLQAALNVLRATAISDSMVGSRLPCGRAAG